MEINITQEELNDIISYLELTKHFIRKQQEQLTEEKNIKFLEGHLEYLSDLIPKLAKGLEVTWVGQGSPETETYLHETKPSHINCLNTMISSYKQFVDSYSSDTWNWATLPFMYRENEDDKQS